jgi:hypothetical protein
MDEWAETQWENVDDFLNDLVGNTQGIGSVGKWSRTGSRVICNPAPTDTDEDFVVWLNEAPEQVTDSVAYLKQNGWTPDENANYEKLKEYGFISLKKNKMNIIYTISDTFYQRFVLATNLAKRLNLLDKQDRIALFQAVLYRHDHPHQQAA